MKRDPWSTGVVRKDRLIREHVHDPYHARLKLTDPTACPECAAVFHKGRWTWSPPPKDAKSEPCPACRRAKDAYPAGVVRLSGEFLRQHKGEILNLVHQQEKREKDAHPLHRIMTLSEDGEGIEITTTDTHLPRGIGQALHNAYEGALSFSYDDDGYFIRVSWSRDD